MMNSRPQRSLSVGQCLLQGFFAILMLCRKSRMHPWNLDQKLLMWGWTLVTVSTKKCVRFCWVHFIRLCPTLRSNPQAISEIISNSSTYLHLASVMVPVKWCWRSRHLCKFNLNQTCLMLKYWSTRQKFELETNCGLSMLIRSSLCGQTCQACFCLHKSQPGSCVCAHVHVWANIRQLSSFLRLWTLTSPQHRRPLTSREQLFVVFELWWLH